jgi:hypothetical protein
MHNANVSLLFYQLSVVSVSKQTKHKTEVQSAAEKREVIKTIINSNTAFPSYKKILS